MHIRRRLARAVLLTGTVFLLCAWGSGQAHADMMLTNAGVQAGFTLSTFASGFPNADSIGPLGIGFTPGGGVMVTDALGNVRVFSTDTDGQNAANASVTANYGVHNAVGIAQVGNTLYMTQQNNGGVVQLNPNGTINQTIVTGPAHATGIFVNPANGHLYVSTSNSFNTIYDVNPLTKTSTPLLSSGGEGDGMTITADGKTLYVAGHDGYVRGYDTTSGAQVFTSSFIPGEPDGLSLGYGTLTGDLFVNTNSGTLWEVNLATGAETLIASGGSRGDFVTVDPNGSLLLTQTDSVLRLTSPPGGGFAPFSSPTATTATPEPSSLALFALVGLGLAGWRWRRRRPSSA
jgi:WD40 repeat protein